MSRYDEAFTITKEVEVEVTKEDITENMSVEDMLDLFDPEDIAQAVVDRCTGSELVQLMGPESRLSALNELFICYDAPVNERIVARIENAIDFDWLVSRLSPLKREELRKVLDGNNSLEISNLKEQVAALTAKLDAVRGALA